jgi:hypothetical protein
VKLSLKILMPFTLAVTLGWTPPVNAQTKPVPATVRFDSVFILPASTKEGRDPFYPESVRTFETKVVASNIFEITSLKFAGVSGTPGHLFAIINNHTFTVGDEGDVMTASGRIHLRCLEVGADSVMVEINGQTHRIKLQTR